MPIQKQLRIKRGRKLTVNLYLGFSVVGDEFYSQIRSGPSTDSELIADWDCSLVTDGSDGRVQLVLSAEKSQNVAHTTAYMDVKRVSNGFPVPFFRRPIEVIFEDVVTE